MQIAQCFRYGKDQGGRRGTDALRLVPLLGEGGWTKRSDRRADRLFVENLPNPVTDTVSRSRERPG